MILLTLLAGCMLGPKPDSCSENADCRGAFGFGSVCGDDGYCAPVDVNPRCDTTWPEDLFRKPENYRDHLIIGSIFNGPFDEKQRLSAELAVRNAWDAQDSDSAYGRYVAIVQCDNAENLDYDNLDTVEAAGSAASFLVDDLGIQAIVGPSTSDESFAVFDAASPGGAITVSPSATSPALTELGGYPTEGSPGLFWRTSPPDDLQAYVIAQDLQDRGITSIVILHEESSYATSLAEAVAANFGGGGSSVTTRSYSNGTELASLISPTFEDGVSEVVFFTGETSDVVTFLDGAANNAANIGRSIFLADAAADSLLFDVGPGAALLPYVRGTRPQVPQGGLFNTFSDNYLTVYGDTPDDSVYTSYTFDAAWLVLYGAMWAEVNGEDVTGNAIGTGFLQLTSGPATEIGYFSVGDIRAAFENGETVDLEGASGTLDFDPVTGEVSNPIEVWVVDEINEDFIPVKLCVPGADCQALTGG